MKKALSSFDVGAIVRELQAYMDWRVDKVYHPESRHLVISLKALGKEKAFLHFRVGEWLYVSDATPETPRHPSAFAMMLRKRITGHRIVSVEQHGFDRIVVLALEKDDRYELVLELFGKGNAILVKDGVIVQPLTSRTWRHREIKAKREFEFPPPIRDPASMSAEELLDVLRASDSDVVRTLATKLNLSGTYSEEICERSGVGRSQPAAGASSDDARNLLAATNAIVDDIRTEQRGYVVTRKGAPLDAAPLRMIIHDGCEQQEYPTFSLCVEDYVARMPAPVEKAKASAGEAELDRLKRKLAQQEEAALRLQRDAVEAQSMGDAIFAAYGDVAHALLTAKDHIAQSKDLGEIPGFISIDRKRARLWLRVGEDEFDLDVNGTVESNAQVYYNKGKKLKAKLAGVLPALEETRAAMADWSKKKAEEDARSTPKREPSKRFWFERYRWFISSEGAIVLGGKDARTNDMLVKKHLQPGDRYVHADIHGAPSVVVKMTGASGERTLAEACEFAVATSKAWNAKIGSGVGYWVLPEQVSKTPQSGEFLARGAFVIRGKRNYSNKADIRLAIGAVEYEGEMKVMCGPVGTFETRSERYIVIRPGTVDKNVFAKAVAELFEVPIEEVQRVLPPGDVDVEKGVGVEVRLNSS